MAFGLTVADVHIVVERVGGSLMSGATVHELVMSRPLAPKARLSQ